MESINRSAYRTSLAAPAILSGAINLIRNAFVLPPAFCRMHRRNHTSLDLGLARAGKLSLRAWLQITPDLGSIPIFSKDGLLALSDRAPMTCPGRRRPTSKRDPRVGDFEFSAPAPIRGLVGDFESPVACKYRRTVLRSVPNSRAIGRPDQLCFMQGNYRLLLIHRLIVPATGQQGRPLASSVGRL